MSKNIADLYNEVMSSQAEIAEKTASAHNDTAFDASFFEKVASGDEEAVGALNAFIDEARSEGHSDEEIEAAIGEAMSEAGIDLDGEAGDEGDDFENAKMAAYEEGVAEAFVHVMDSDYVKTAGLTEQDLMEYELGLAKGQGYAETRAALEAVVEKIAEAKIAGLAEMASRARGAVSTAAKRGKDLLTASNVRANVKEIAGEGAGMRDKGKAYLDILRGKAGNSAMTSEARKSLGAQAVGAGALGAGAFGAKKMYDRRKKK